MALDEQQMTREYWLRHMSRVGFVPISLSGDVFCAEIMYMVPSGQTIGLFWGYGENGIDIYESFVYLFNDLEIQREAVRSSNIVSIGHDSRLSFLDIEFTGGSVYRYYGVPAKLFCEFVGAESHGKFLAKEIKGKFVYIKLPDA